MASSCPLTSINRVNGDASLNVTKLLLQRYNISPKDDKERLEKCWGFSDCGDCHRSDGFCGWCGLTSTCLPLPTDTISRAFPLLTPVRYKYICPQVGERFELRTAGLGCQVSTITFLTSIFTILGTLFGVAVLYFLLKCAKWIGWSLRAQRGGYALLPNDHLWNEGIWKRQPKHWLQWRRNQATDCEDLISEDLSKVSAGNGWTWWGNTRTGHGKARSGERQPLLGDQMGDN